jgi:hypothetical protein
MAQYNQSDFGQGNYTYGNMNQWGQPQSTPDFTGGLTAFQGTPMFPTPVPQAEFSAVPTPQAGTPSTNYSLGMPGAKYMTNEEPVAAGQWIEPAKIGLGAAKVGLGAYNAFQSAKMNKFMRSYYDDIRDLQKADFANSARSTNTALEGQRERQLDSQGIAAGSDANKARVASYMKSHGVDETA